MERQLGDFIHTATEEDLWFIAEVCRQAAQMAGDKIAEEEERQKTEREIEKERKRRERLCIRTPNPPKTPDAPLARTDDICWGTRFFYDLDVGFNGYCQKVRPEPIGCTEGGAYALPR